MIIREEAFHREAGAGDGRESIVCSTEDPVQGIGGSHVDPSQQCEVLQPQLQCLHAKHKYQLTRNASIAYDCSDVMHVAGGFCMSGPLHLLRSIQVPLSRRSAKHVRTYDCNSIRQLETCTLRNSETRGACRMLCASSSFSVRVTWIMYVSQSMTSSVLAM